MDCLFLNSRPEAQAEVHANTGQIIVIPCHQEPDVLPTLQSLQDAHRPARPFEVIWVLNAAAHNTEAQVANQETLAIIQNWHKHQSQPIPLLVLTAHDLPAKHAGVGLARRIGMDLACQRLQAIKQTQSPIVCLDADCMVAPNYLQAIEQHFDLDFPRSPACSIAFEHPLHGPLEGSLYAGILRYELYLRYYIQALRFVGLPYAYHTIGSSMAVRVQTYQTQGGMNRRKAGEDFYFLHKLMPLGSFSELNSTRVYPSPRISQRVPFGTGRAMGEWQEQPAADYPVYHPQIFADLRQMTTAAQSLCPLDEAKAKGFIHELPESVRAWFEQENALDKLLEIQANSASESTFRSRFYRWFDGFIVLKYTHFARDHFYGIMPIQEAAQTLAEYQRWDYQEGMDLKDWLWFYRIKDQGEF